tara:strand:- start:725 stop:1150 length:426 start_codon:yes stop_codon:yes gene_type:complete
MKITKRQLKRIIQEEVIAEARRKSSSHQQLNELGFLDKAMDMLGGLFGSDMPDLKAVSMKKAEKILAQALATYAMSSLTAEGGDISSSNFASQFDEGLKKAMDAAKTAGNTLSTKMKKSKITSKPEKEKKGKKPGLFQRLG